MEYLWTFSLFYSILLLIPFLGFSYLILSLAQTIWLFFVEILYPEVEFFQKTSIRSLLDTHRNQGITAVLLSVKGKAQLEAVRRHLQEIVKRRDKSGNLVFPRLRHCLVTRCGNYAWQRRKFDLDQNLILAPMYYKGRSVTEYNIQEYVCEIVSKYLPHGVSPWQIIVIPSSEDHHYILVKVHHVLLDEGLNIGDLLPLIPPTSPKMGILTPRSLFANILPKPVFIAKLHQQLSEEISNIWNEYVASHDPLECLELLKKTPGFLQFLAIFPIVIVSTIRESRRGYHHLIENDLLSKTKYTLATLRKQCRNRRVNFSTFIKSIGISLNPRNFAQFVIKLLGKTAALPFYLYFRLWKEIRALYCCLVQHYCIYSDTIVGSIYVYFPLLFNSFKEILFYAFLIIETPRIMLRDILLQKELFQTITLCGRKAVAWSDPVKTELIQSISKATGVSETEVMLSAISACISKYLIQTKHVIPDFLPVALKNINSNYLFATGIGAKPENSFNGIICVNLPILDPEKEASILENLVAVKHNVQDSLEKQKMIHLLTLLETKFGFLTKIIPLSVLGIYLRFLSRKYPVSITEISSKYPNVTQKTLWGQEVNSVVYWWPPQANSSVSLCLNEYADHFKLGVMCDAQLAPHHPFLARGFPQYIQDLRDAVCYKKL